jgi:hypothetical protein
MAKATPHTRPLTIKQGTAQCALISAIVLVESLDVNQIDLQQRRESIGRTNADLYKLERGRFCCNDLAERAATPCGATRGILSYYPRILYAGKSTSLQARSASSVTTRAGGQSGTRQLERMPHRRIHACLGVKHGKAAHGSARSGWWFYCRLCLCLPPIGQASWRAKRVKPNGRPRLCY